MLLICYISIANGDEMANPCEQFQSRGNCFKS